MRGLHVLHGLAHHSVYLSHSPVSRRDWPYARQDVTDHVHVVARAGCATEYQGVPGSARECQGMPGSARECQGVPGSARECQGVPGSAG